MTRVLDRAPDSVRLMMDSWKFWVGVAYIGLAGVVVALYILFEHQTNEATRRIAIQRASAQANLSSCVTSVKNAPVIEGFLDAHRAIINNSLLTTAASLQATAGDDPLRAVRLASIGRLHKALRNVDALDALIASRTPTRAGCDDLAKSLGIPAPFHLTHK